ncbi:uncharacterized protein TrAFT101_006091 [Trichoderma asperellum]|uniref:uncharacterized protein n=1 Tax=Trichoderma asperellum TaxID=101201 RepID=UPI00332C2452|nr:hypothetical protein TrAFT101_006091 [Trichoderma asperellum]
MSSFKGSVSVTYIGTATALLQIDNVSFLTDPFFSPSGSEWVRPVVVLKNTQDPAVKPEDLPHIDAVLLSHEDHPITSTRSVARSSKAKRFSQPKMALFRLETRPYAQVLTPVTRLPSSLAVRLLR